MSEDVRLSIHRYFEEFGFEIGEAIFKELCRPGGLPKLLKKLSVPSEGSVEEQYAILIQYLRARGTNDFMKLVGLKPIDYKIGFVPSDSQKNARDRKSMQPSRAGGSADSSTQAVGGKSPDSLMETRKLKPAELPPPRPASTSQTPPRAATPPPSPIEPPKPTGTPHPRPASIADKKAIAGRQNSYDVVDSEGFPVGPLMPGAPPAGGQPGLSWDTAKPFDPNGTWPEAERRSPRERRRRGDRRSAIDLVYKNLRYGRDRRQSGERRKGWPWGGHQK